MANDLLDAVEKAIMERLPIAESFELYHSVKERQYKYYRIYVKNFVMYYVVNDGTYPYTLDGVTGYIDEFILLY